MFLDWARILSRISQLMALDFAVIFIQNTCKMITIGGDGRLIFTGRVENLLWRLNISARRPDSSANMAVADSSSVLRPKADYILQRWHNRVGHASASMIKQMALHWSSSRFGSYPLFSSLFSITSVLQILCSRKTTSRTISCQCRARTCSTIRRFLSLRYLWSLTDPKHWRLLVLCYL